jgi:CRP/FNR family transcriptional regulator, dissimilatory nitrate respiration regulator
MTPLAGGTMMQNKILKRVDASVVLSQLPLFQEVGKDLLDHIAGYSHQQKLAKGTFLFQKGDHASGFFVIVTGKIKLALSVSHNNERVIDVLSPGQSFGEALMFLNRPYPVYAQAISDATLIHVAQDPIFELLACDPFFARRMLAGMSMRLHHLILDIDTFSQQTGTQRVVSFILQHLPDSSTTAENTTITFPLPCTKQLVASRLCLAPETLSRSLHELVSNGLIEVNGKLIFVKNIQALRSYNLHH